MYTQVYRLLRESAKTLKNDLRKMIEKNGITWQQFHALYHIPAEGAPVNELAKKLNCNASNMTGLIDRMTENGWVYRKHSEEDRRVWLIMLTEEGAALRERLIPEHNENIHKRLSVLSTEELETMKQLLTKLKNNTNDIE